MSRPTLEVRCLYCRAVGVATPVDIPPRTYCADVKHVDGCDAGESGLPFEMAFEWRASKGGAQ